MREQPSLRIVTTNDIFGGVLGQPTSCGRLPGGHALTATVDRLREHAAQSVWVDAGDFAGGGPLAPASKSALSWAAAATLGIDVAVPGNHEFDYGDDVFVQQARQHDLELMATDLCDDPAFADVGIAGSRMLAPLDGPPVALLGLTFPERRGLDVYDVLADHDAAVQRVTAAAADARADGAGSVVLVMHEGVPVQPSTADRVPGGQFARIRAMCASLRGSVDAIIGGHTVAHFAGEIAGMPFLQPWSYGAEIGVLDISRDGLRLSTVPVLSKDSAAWEGPGADLHHRLSTEIVGELPRPLATPGASDADDLRDAVAAGLAAKSGAQIAIVHASDVGCVQPALDGCYAWLPAGPVSEADLLRVLPWPDGALGDGAYCADLQPGEVDDLIAGFSSEDGLRAGVARTADGGATLVSRNYLDKARRLLGREADWRPVGIGQRDGLRFWIANLQGGKS